MRLLIGVLWTCVTARFACGAPYWVAYEGNDFPENEGWGRTITAGGATRSLGSGSMRLDSLRSNGIVDYYSYLRPIDPVDGEIFVAEWAVNIHSVGGPVLFDQTVTLFSDTAYAVVFEFGEHSARSLFETGVSVSYEPNVMHVFQFRSPDMRAYELFVDGVPRANGTFSSTFSASRVSWGDGVQGARSDATWDYFRFGVVPEPSTVCLFLVGAARLRCRSSQRRRTLAVVHKQETSK